MARESKFDLLLLRENLNSIPGLPVLVGNFSRYFLFYLTFWKDVPVPFFQEKPIYKRGKFKWATSFGQRPIDYPPFSPSNARLSEGDVFVWVDTASSPSSPDRVRVWCSFTTLSRSLVWRRVAVLEDIRIIGNARYTLSLSKNTEPSWILVKSATDLRLVTKSGWQIR